MATNTLYVRLSNIDILVFKLYHESYASKLVNNIIIIDFESIGYIRNNKDIYIYIYIYIYMMSQCSM